jgi:hypothetical protein
MAGTKVNSMPMRIFTIFAIFFMQRWGYADPAILRVRAKITSHFKAPMHPAWLRCESLKYLDSPALSRLAMQAPQHLNVNLFLREPLLRLFEKVAIQHP